MKIFKQFGLVLVISLLSGCAAVDTVKKYWPRAHDPVMFDQLVQIDVALEKVNCDSPNWDRVSAVSENLVRYTEWRKDPQHENIKGLHAHVQRMSRGGSKSFCELGKKTASQRVNAAKSAWEGR